MVETFGMFGDASDVRTYNQPAWLEFMRDLRGDGYVYNGLAVSQHTPALMGVDVAIGEAWIQGCWYSSNAVIALAIAAADAVNPRIDRIILRNNITGSRKITAMVLTGTPAAVPVAPALTRTADIWDICIAQVAVAAGATSILTANITDKRTDLTVCGASYPDCIRASGIIPLEAFNVNSKRLTNSALPAAGGDGATVGYANTKTIPLPTGIIYWFAGAAVLAGYLECNGQAVSRTTYPGLFAVFGTTWGAGDGSTTFNLPDLRGRTIFGFDSTQTEFDAIAKTGGAATVTLAETNLPAHHHSAATFKVGSAGVSAGANSKIAPGAVQVTTSDPATGGGAHNNLQPFATMIAMVRGL
jgi:microcystin-dependent protein